MAAGIQATVAGINQSAGQLVTQARDAARRLIDFNDYLNTVGSAGLVALGFTSADAATLISTIGNHAAWAQIYEGTTPAGPALPFNFRANGESLWGGQ